MKEHRGLLGTRDGGATVATTIETIDRAALLLLLPPPLLLLRVLFPCFAAIRTKLSLTTCTADDDAATTTTVTALEMVFLGKRHSRSALCIYSLRRCMPTCGDPCMDVPPVYRQTGHSPSLEVQRPPTVFPSPPPGRVCKRPWFAKRAPRPSLLAW
eukprot:GHVU01017493.1.p1 GENE.GHVU01017493.1~~GHVU01017493.1.p1  ORF type:complete len:156 (-),score=9.95 GHVU01017493.1:136-603(-)